MKTVIFFFGEAMKEACWLREDIVLFDDNGWWLKNGSSRTAVLPNGLINNNSIYQKYNPVEIIKKLRSWGPIWSRWCGRGDQHELLLRDALLLVIQIAAGLEELQVKRCIMHTGVAHHIDSIIFELACEQAGVKVVYLYAEVFTWRLIPLEINGSVVDRKILGATVSDYNYTYVLSEFLEDYKRGKQPKLNNKVRHLNTIWMVAIYFIIKGSIKNKVRLVIKSILNKLSANSLYKEPVNIFRQFHNRYPFLHFKQVLQQRDALDFMKRNLLEERSLDSLSFKKISKLLIAAHYQPEATSFPEGGEFGNHIDIVLQLRALGCRDTIFYKEHKSSLLFVQDGQPTGVGMYRSREYFQQLLQLDCTFIPVDFNLSVSNPLADTFLPVTITGSIAIERSLAGLHTIVAGYPWFKDMPGVLKLSEIESLAILKPEWLKQDAKLAKNAFEFLERNLSGKTIINAPGIGGVEPLASDEDKISWSKEFGLLLDNLMIERI